MYLHLTQALVCLPVTEIVGKDAFHYRWTYSRHHLLPNKPAIAARTNCSHSSLTATVNFISKVLSLLGSWRVVVCSWAVDRWQSSHTLTEVHRQTCCVDPGQRLDSKGHCVHPKNWLSISWITIVRDWTSLREADYTPRLPSCWRLSMFCLAHDPPTT